MKLIKKYFLFFSPAPFIINSVIFVVMLIGVTIWGLITSPNGYDATPMVLKVSFLLPILIVGNIILCYIIRSKYITFDNDEENMRRLILVTNDGNMVIKKPVWEKGKKYFLFSPYKNGYTWDDSEVSATTSIKGQYKNASMAIPVTITLKLDKKFDELALFNFLHDKFPQKKNLNVKDYIEEVFHKFNLNNQDKINGIMGQYAQKLISDPELLNQIVESILFPERLFDNVIDTKICLEKVTFSSCKGMICGSAKARVDA